ncbi:hypothetical protein ACJ41O_007154 [Fusarium nematophilum]
MTLIPMPPTYPDVPLVPPYRIPDEVVDELKALLSSDDLSAFKTALHTYLAENAPPDFNIGDLTPVMDQAIEQDKTEFISVLMESGMTVIHHYVERAIRNKSKKALETFLNSGWKVNEPIDERQPPVLRCAVKDEEMTLWLLDHRADVNQQSRLEDITPLSYAVRDSPLDVLETLLNKDGDVHKGELLHYAVGRPSDAVQVIDMLLARGASLTSLKYEKHPKSRMFYPFMGNGTVLHTAAEDGKMDIVKHLIEKGADKDIKDRKGMTAAEVAEVVGHHEVARYLESV